MNRCVHGLPTILRRLIKANNHIDFFNDELFKLKRIIILIFFNDELFKLKRIIILIFLNDELILFYWGGRKHEIIDYREPKTSPKYEQTGATYFFIITKFV